VRQDVPELNVCPAAITPLSLVFFELATNAVKYGGLSEAGDGVAIRAEQHGERLIVQWTEVCV
jgi:two-component sensor histidine kinase